MSSQIWNYDRIMLEAENRPTIDFSLIKPEQVVSRDSVLPFVCKICQREWTTTIKKMFVRTKKGCPHCCGNSPRSYERLLTIVATKHNVEIDLSTVNKIRLDLGLLINCRCTRCNKEWSITVRSLFGYQRSGTCLNCDYVVTIWNYEQVMIKAASRPEIDFSLITPDMKISSTVKLPFRCNKCGKEWRTVLFTVLGSRKGGCGGCKGSKGEKEIISFLQKHSIQFEKEVILPSLPGKRYDFQATHNSVNYLIEFDGKHHFQFTKHCHQTIEGFEERQEVDKLKFDHALQQGYKVIRIDYSQLSRVEIHLNQGLQSSDNYYLSTPEFYSYLF